MRKKANRKNILIIGLFLTAIFMGIGYAVYSQNLIVETAGGILADWKLRFTDVVLDTEFGEGIDQSDVVNITTSVLDDDLIMGVELSLTFPEDYVTYEIEITNFSETWDAKYLGVDIDYITNDSADDSYILWDVDFGTNLANGDVILADSSGDGTGQAAKFILTGYWNPALRDETPEGATKDYETTYKENATITLHFEASKPVRP